MDTQLAIALSKWASRCVENKEQLEIWLDAAVIAIAEGKGAQLISTSGNGMTVAFSQKGMTTSEWFSTLSRALDLVANPQVSKVQGLIR